MNSEKTGGRIFINNTFPESPDDIPATYISLFPFLTLWRL